MESLADLWRNLGPLLSFAAAWGAMRSRLSAVEARVSQQADSGVTVARVETAMTDIGRRLDRIERILDRSGNHVR